MAAATVSNRRAHTRDRVMDAAIALFAEKGVLAASVEEICERAGFTRGAFYSNFESRDDLMIAVVERKGRQILAATQEAVRSIPEQQVAPGCADDVIREAMLVFQASRPIDAQWLIARKEMRLYALRTPATREALRAVEASLDTLLIEAIEDVLARQGARLKVPADNLVLLLSSYQEALALRELLNDHDADGPEWATQLAAVVRELVEFPQPGP